jgi:hypothetical protein
LHKTACCAVVAGKIKNMNLTTYTGYKKVEKSETPTWDEIKDGALVLYKNGYLETIAGHIRFFDKRQDGTDEWVHFAEGAFVQ